MQPHALCWLGALVLAVLSYFVAGPLLIAAVVVGAIGELVEG